MIMGDEFVFEYRTILESNTDRQVESRNFVGSFRLAKKQWNHCGTIATSGPGGTGRLLELIEVSTMYPIIVLLVAMLIVIGSVVILRLHAFLALLIGAIVVAVLSQPSSVRDTELRAMAYTVRDVDASTGQVLLKPPKDKSRFAGPASLFRMDDSTRELTLIGGIELGPTTEAGMQPISAGDSSINAGDIIVRDPEPASVLAAQNFAKRITGGFGATCAKIGILIALASIVGTCLLESGAADRVVTSIRQGLGERNTPAAFTISGFVVGIPVFFDTVFYLLLPLAKAMRKKTGRNYLLYVLSVVIGGTMAHSLVPPTPGPLFVADELGVDLGRMMLGGTAIGLFAAACGFGYAVLANKWWTIDLPDEPDSGAAADRAESTLPPLWLSLLPILLPVALLGARTILKANEADGAFADLIVKIDSTIAIGIAACIGLLMLVKYAPAGASVRDHIQTAIQDAGSIILITSIGGAFGQVLRQSGIAFAIQEKFPITQSGTALLCMAFAITAIVRVAQGSATVSMITSIGIVGPLAATMQLPFDPVYLALAIGCGSKPMPWMNDSGFWVVGRMSGMSERETLSTFSVCLTIMGFAGFGAVLVASRLLPLVPS